MHFDAVVIGGGPVGAAAALALEGAALNVLLVEARAALASPTDTRPIAVSHGSRLILERLDVWRRLPNATPITRIHVSQRGRFGRAVFTADEAGLPALGYVVDYATLASVLDSAVADAQARGRLQLLRGSRVGSVAHDRAAAHIRFEPPSVLEECDASVVAVADGNAEAAGVDVRIVEYDQGAVSARVETDLDHGNTAYERFTPEGPLALLPCGPGYAVVWVSSPRSAEDLCAATPVRFLNALQERFGDRAGRFTAVAGRASYRIALRVAEHPTAGRAALIGNSAQALHPVAGQGLNLGLRDAWELSGEIRKRGPTDPGLMQAFSARRRIDRSGGIGFTHALVKIFSNDWLPFGVARGIGLTLLDTLPPAKDFVVRRMIFGARG
jgi:2-octaprenyl-6-methoxyphenol hydroxylase